MFIPHGLLYDAFATGSVLREETCEKCGWRFWYVLTRTAKGREQAPFFLGSEKARQAASEQARAKLAAVLAQDVEPVACPQCGEYQQAMVFPARRRRLSLSSITFLAILAWILPQLLIYAPQPPRAQTLGAVALVAFFVVFFGLLSYRARYDPAAGRRSRIVKGRKGEPTPFATPAEAQQHLLELANRKPALKVKWHLSF
jgi:hypothetical protein